MSDEKINLEWLGNRVMTTIAADDRVIERGDRIFGENLGMVEHVFDRPHR
jgi:hypothetical protein